MRIPGTRSATGSTILQQSSQEDERKAARRRSKQQSQQQLQTGILATGNLLGDVARTIPQFQANSIRESEGAKDRAFEQAMIQAKQGYGTREREAGQRFSAGESVLDRQARIDTAKARSTPLSEALALLAAERTDKRVKEIDADTSIAPDVKERAVNALLSGQSTPELQQVQQQRAMAAPLRQAAGQAGIQDVDLVAKGEPGAFQGMDRDTAMSLLGNTAINQGENSPALRQIAEKLGYALPERTPLQNFGRGVAGTVKDAFMPKAARTALFGPDLSVDAEQEIMQLLQALKSQYGPTATDRGYTSTQPLSPAARQYILSIRQQLGK